MDSDDAVDSSKRVLTPSDRGPVADDVDPWARGGAMSRTWVTPEVSSPPAATRPGRPTLAEPTSLRRLVAATVALAAVAGGTAWWRAAGEPSPAVSSVPADAAVPVSASIAPSANRSTSDTIVGTISWTRIDGDASSLPARITGGDGGALFGDDESGQRWRSDDGSTWVHGAAGELREVGGVDWYVDGRRRLQRERESERVDALIDVAEDAPEHGFDVVADIAFGSSDGFPFALDGEIFVLSTVRAELPWAEISGRSPGDPYRVKVSAGDDEIGVVLGDFHEMPVSRFALRTDDQGRSLIENSVGEVVWSFAPPDDSLWSSLDIIAGVPHAIWSRWDGVRFVAAPTPWGEDDRIDVAATRGNVLARSVRRRDRRSVVWRTDDGRDWVEVTLPDPAKDGTQVGIRQGDREAIVTAITDAGATSWATDDGVTFEQLAPFTGVESRTRTSFGWLAEHPRSAPQIGVSPDGSTWDSVDLRDLLGLDDSSWGVTITARAIGSEIVVLVDRPAGRTLAIGTVQPGE